VGLESVMAERSFLSWVQIIGKLTPVYRQVRALPADKRTDVDTLLPIADTALGVLEAEGVTLGEVRALLKNAGPLVELLGELR
jgi:hypothetical protein